MRDKKRMLFIVTIMLLSCLSSNSKAFSAEVVKIPSNGDWHISINQLKPGQIGQLASGIYLGGKTISVNGTAEKPIVIRGNGHLTSVFDGKGGGQALKIKDSAHLILENVSITNRSPYGIDGMHNYSKKARAKLAEGIMIINSSDIAIRHARFFDIATRGILAIKGTKRLKIENNLFLGIGDDTASADIAAGGQAAVGFIIRENIFAGNVDGVMFDGVGAGHTIARNIFCFAKWENCIDIKRHFARADEDPWTVIRNNIIYADHSRFSGIELQDGTDNVKVYQNAIYGARTYGLQIRGRHDDLKNIEIIGNWFDARDDSDKTAIKTRVYDKSPGGISNVYILHNIFSGYKYALRLNHGENIFICNNIFDGCSIISPISKTIFDTNLYTNTARWSDDKNAISAKPIYKWQPVGPLAAESPGFNQAITIRGYDWGKDIGLPQGTQKFDLNEASILEALQNFFTRDEINACLNRGGIRQYAKPDRPSRVKDVKVFKTDTN